MPWAAAALVFLTSGAILVLEILAIRLLAPYVGVTLQTYTAIIGTVLAGIALGTGVGGYLADRLDPRRMLGPVIVAGGVLSAATVGLARLLGENVTDSGPATVVLLTVATFLVPAAVLGAVSPVVVKLQLRDLGATGRVVGRLSALGTAGALAGTFVAGFFLVEAAPTSTTIVGIGVGLVILGAAVWVWAEAARRRSGAVGMGTAGIVVVAVVAGSLGVGSVALGPDPCEEETTYHCARIEADPRRPGGRTLVLDTLRHSYVDLADPTYLEFRYINLFAETVQALAPEGPLDVVHLGGGGFTMPRYLRATRPGTVSTVLEIDGGLVDLVRRRLGLTTGEDLRVVVGDARLSLAEIPSGTGDIVLGDAFGGLAVPWHLTTVEFVSTIRSVLGPRGFYVANVIDYPPRRFVRSELATLAAVFDHVALVAPPTFVGGASGGNYVLVAGDTPIDAAAIAAQVSRRGGAEVVLTGVELDAFVDGAPVLTDDKAPVDQFLGRPRL